MSDGLYGIGFIVFSVCIPLSALILKSRFPTTGGNKGGGQEYVSRPECNAKFHGVEKELNGLNRQLERIDKKIETLLDRE